MAIATGLGIFFGLFFGELTKVFAPWADAYVMILKITIIPYLACAIIHGIGQLGIGQAKEILKKGLFFIALVWVINILLIYMGRFLFPIVKGHLLGTYVASQPVTLNFAEMLIPQNIFYSLSNNIVPAIVVFSLLAGISLMYLKEKKTTMGMLETIVEGLTMMTGWISRITPVGTFIIIANQVGTIELTTIGQIGTYLILYIVVLCIGIFWIFPQLISMLTNIPASKWLKDMSPILLLAYTTNVVIVCLPYIMVLVQREILVRNPQDEKAQSQIQGTVSTLFNLPMGSFFIALFIFFAATFYNAHLTVANQVQMFLTVFFTGLGAVGIGSWLNSITFLVDSMALPMDSIDLFLTTLPFTAGFQSMIGVMEIATISLFITFATRKMIAFKWTKMIKSIFIIVVPVILFFLMFKIWNPFPPITNKTKSIYEINIKDLYWPRVLQENAPAASISIAAEDTFDRILRTKILRVGFYSQIPPFAFYNNAKQLVGYDIAFAYRLAADLGAQLVFVPMKYETLSDDLDKNQYDIAMSSVSISEARLMKVSFSHPYLEGKYVLVVRDAERKNFSSLSSIRSNSDIKIAVLKNSAFDLTAKILFPNKEIVQLDSYDDFAKSRIADAILWSEPQAISWVIQNPTFTIAYTDTLLGVSTFGYPVKENASRFLSYINQWLELKKNEGFTQDQYDLWVLGKTTCPETAAPRWSIIRNLLHWTK